jgi:Lhr-like helicase
MAEVYEIIKSSQTALIFVNTRFQAEFAFQRLWELNDDGLPSPCTTAACRPSSGARSRRP